MPLQRRTVSLHRDTQIERMLSHLHHQTSAAEWRWEKPYHGDRTAVLRTLLDSAVPSAKQTILAGVLPEPSRPSLDEVSTATEEISLPGQ